MVSVLKAHLRYLWYVLRHKYYVFLWACKLGIGWRGLLHDLSKFRPCEWFPYARHFYGMDAKSDEACISFLFAVHLHHKKNDHHHQWWVLPGDGPLVKTWKMSEPAVRELLADWLGVADALGTDAWEWYLANGHRLMLHSDTRHIVETALHLLRKVTR